MKKALFLCLFFSSICFAAESLTEKQIEDFKAQCIELYLTDASEYNMRLGLEFQAVGNSEFKVSLGEGFLVMKVSDFAKKVGPASNEAVYFAGTPVNPGKTCVLKENGDIYLSDLGTSQFTKADPKPKLPGQGNRLR